MASAPDLLAITLRHSALRLGIDRAGGRLTEFSWSTGAGRFDLFRPAAAGGSADPRDAACFPLLPYSGRIRGGQIPLDGGAYRLSPNHPQFPTPIHGDGWLGEWQIADMAVDRARLQFTHLRSRNGGWPWSYDAEQAFALDGNGLAAELAITNRDHTPMPAGLGLHPYFPRHGAASLRAAASQVWLSDAATLPTQRIAVPPAFDLSEFRAVDRLDFDHCFGGWVGHAEIVWAGAPVALRLQADPGMLCLVVYTPRGQSFFCVEPVSHAPDSFARAAAGDNLALMQWLQPGASLRATVRFEVLASAGNSA